jgi:glycosyltransferase involved in cell wall biosynthesis
MDSFRVEQVMPIHSEKKSLFVVPGLYPCAVGGAEVFNEALIRKLALESDIEYISTCDTLIPHANRIHLPKSSAILQLFFIFFRLTKVHRDRTIVTSYMRTKWYYIAIYPLLSFFLKKKYIIIVHGGGLAPWTFKAPYRWYFRKARKVFGVSEIICQEYSARANVKVEYLPPLIPFNKSSVDKVQLRHSYGFSKSEKIFLSVGSLKELKRPFAVICAAEHLGHDFLKKHNVRFVFAGDGPLKNKMRNYIEERGLGGFITLLGSVPREKIHELYKLSDSYIISSDFEGTPISMLEAMANELSIIGSKVSGIDSILSREDMGFLFDNKKPQELADIICHVVKDGADLEKVKARKFYLENFSYERVLDQIRTAL